MIFYLFVRQGPNKGDQYKVTSGRIVIGRDAEKCQIMLTDPKVSRVQCEVVVHGSAVTVRDLSQKNTLKVNEQDIEYATLQDKDEFSFGQTTMEIQSQNSHALSGAQNALPAGQNATPEGEMAEPPKKKLLTPPRMIFGVVLLGLVAFLLMPSTKKIKQASIASLDAPLEQVDKSQERQQDFLEPDQKLSRTEIVNRKKSEQLFIRGFRDYQNKKYTRAIQAFQTSLATNKNNVKAHRYHRLAVNKQQTLIHNHIDLGRKYREKNMYRFCAAEFAKVMQIINQPENPKYKLAKEQHKECRLYLGRGK